MILLLASFSISFIVYLVFDTLRRCRDLATKLNSDLPSVSYADCYLEAINLDMQEFWTYVPTFLKGSLTQRENEKHTDEIVQRSVQDGTVAAPPLAVVTGGDSGIGFEICKGLLSAGYHVIIGAHSEKSCKEAIAILQKETLSDKVSCIPLDLSRFKSVRDFASQVQSKMPKKDIDLLINNAGVMNIPFRKTVDGFESQCQINFLSPVLLTQLLLPSINPECGRVLFASSSTMYAVNDLDVNTPTKSYNLNGLNHYAYSKACVAQLVSYMAKMSPIKIYSYHPGTVRTKLFSTTTVFNLPLVSMIFNVIMYSPKEGSQTPLFLSLSQNLKESGTYWANERKQKLPSILVNGEKHNLKALWIDTMSKIGLDK